MDHTLSHRNNSVETSVSSGDQKEKLSSSQDGHFLEIAEVIEPDAVFGESKKYSGLGWKGATVICLKIQLGLGVLSIPKVLSQVGYGTGVIIILVLAALTTWSSIILGQTKAKHREIASVGDWGMVIGYPLVADVITVVYILCKILDGASAYVSLSIGLNVISYHGACTILFVAVVAIAAFSLASIETLAKISILGWIALAAIMSSIMTATIAVALQERPALAPAVGLWSKNLEAFANPSFAVAVSACGEVLFAYAGIPIYMNVLTEMREPKDYNKAVLIAQGFVTVVYLSLGIVVYYYAGQYVSSPALGTAGIKIARIAYGLALPGLLMSSLIFTHISAKTLFIRILRNSQHLTASTRKHYVIWYSCVAAIACSSFLIAAGVPVFSGLIGFSGAVLGSFLCLVLPGFMWLYDNRSPKSLGKKVLTAITIGMIIIGIFLIGAGAYSSGVIIQAAISKSKGAFSCVDNSK